MMRRIQVYGLGGTEVRVNGYMEHVKEKFGQLLKSVISYRVAHVFSLNGNIGLSQ